MKTKLNLLLAPFAFLIFLGCDFNVPLVDQPQLPIDRNLTGLWVSANTNDTTDSLLVLPLDAQQYLVAYPAAHADSMYARACLATSAAGTIVQLTWFGTAKGGTPDDARLYQYARYSVTNDALAVEMLNTSVIDKNIITSAELAKAIETHKDDPDLFDKRMDFVRAKE